MGDYPYPSNYMLNGQGVLPAYPMRAACQPLSQQGMAGAALLEGLHQAVGTFYNFSGHLPCYNYSEGPNPEGEEDSNFWDYQACTEMVMPFSRNGGQHTPFATFSSVFGSVLVFRHASDWHN
jgi:lysosomal Pro-X carboxypeptidase